MSLKGSILRGNKWHDLMRDVNGNVVCNDVDKQTDINNYLNSKKVVEKPKVAVAKEKK